MLVHPNTSSGEVPTATMETVNVAELVERLGSDEDAVRKMAVFKLQSNIGDPSFADIFIVEGGLTRLRYLTLHASGNTLAYSLTSFARLLEVDKGWECVDQELVERIVELIVTHPLVNILRGAMSILVSIVSHPHTGSRASEADLFGFRALKPAIAIYPQFLEMLVSRLSSADHALCANALQLINSLMRDSITFDSEAEWPKFIQKLQDLGVIRAVYVLMQDSALQDLAHPLLEFQSLTKVLLRKWRDIPLNQEKPEHRRALKGIYLASNPTKGSVEEASETGEDTRRSKRHQPDKWRRLGFETESPAAEFHEVGFLGMMDLADYVRSHQYEFQKMLLEQSTKPARQRCPIARASLAVTSILYEHFEVDESEMDDSKNYMMLESRSNFDKLFKPLLLHWTRLHVAGLQAFFRLWKATAAESEDLDKLVELVRILIESVVGGAGRTKDVQDIEEELANYEYHRLRELQMELLELTYEDAWGQHLRQVREELHHEALQFVKEQRIRCLLQGAWFALEPPSKTETGAAARSTASNQYVQLSHNRRYLHFGEFDSVSERAPELDALPEKIDLSTVSSVVSNVSTAPDNASSATVKTAPRQVSTKITIHGYAPSSTGHSKSHTHTRTVSKTTQKEVVLLTLRPASHSVASEWLDGLLMLLNQQPITAETTKLIDLVGNYGLKIRLLNRQRRSAHSEEDPHKKLKARSPSLDPSTSTAVALSSRPKSKNPRTTRATQTKPTRAPSSSVSPKKPSSSPQTTKSKSLHTFFPPATDAQRWSAQKFEAKRPLATTPETTLDADVIEDDYDSYDEIFTQHLAVGGKTDTQIDSPVAHGASKTRRPAPKKTAGTKSKSHISKRFVMPPEPKNGDSRQSPAPASVEVDGRPWAQRYGPSNLDEIAVHKRKVSDVRRWLEDAFAGRRKEVSVLVQDCLIVFLRVA
ncbi:Engulfment and cell motility protein 1 [Penicillium rolfsii]|nr:Engulfment and cell motility protein 1 [Penicillium rolfsii]